MIIVDAHCDTITKLMDLKEEIYESSCHIDLKRLKAKDECVQFFAAFINPKYGQSYSLKRVIQIIDKIYIEEEKNKSIFEVCKNYADVDQAIRSGKIAGIISVEGGDALQGDISVLRILYRLGVRSICLTWNYRNEIADGILDSRGGGGLTPFGLKVIEQMNLLGMIIDVSHISESGFWDVIKYSKVPIIASHSNAKNLCSHVRNLTNEQLVAIKEIGGVVGINFYPDFLSNDKNSSLTDIVKHISYIVDLIGWDHIGIGTDFDGIETVPDGISDVQDIHKIFNELKRIGVCDQDIKKFSGDNFLRVIKEVCKS